MPRTITTRGIAKLSLSPDLTVVSLSLRSTDKKYDAAMEKAGKQLKKLTDALKAVGFEETDIKTTNFNVNTEYESVPDEKGRYKQVFKGFGCYQNLKVEFPFDSGYLADVLSAIAESVSEPELNVQFTVKDKSKAGKELLKKAAEDAREKAEVLAEASGARLGTLLSIDYNLAEHNFRSPTVYTMEESCMKMARSCDAINITPDDIIISDSVTFVWELN